MKRVLIISYYWPPSGGSGVQRWVKMCKYLPSLGWMPVVYTPENPAVTATDDTLGADVPQCVEVLRQPIVEPGQFMKKTTSAQVTPINSQKKTLKQRITMWIRGNCFIPDPRVLWVRPSVRYLLKYLKDHPVDVIISTGPPHSMHLIAKELSRRTGIPWAADFRDPWTKMYFFKHLSLSRWADKKHHRLEKSVLDRATRIITVTPLMQRDFEQMTYTPVEMITNGYDADDFADMDDQAACVECRHDASENAENAGQGDRFVVLHAGLLASDGNPVELWKVLGEMASQSSAFKDKLQLVLCGKTDRTVLEAIEQAGLGGNLTNLGYLDHKAVVEQMKRASMLLLPLRNDPQYRPILPGKLFEYLASRRPILGIGQKDGAMAAVLESTGAGKTCDWQEGPQMRALIEEWFASYQAGTLASNDADIRQYSREGLAVRLASLLDSITGNW